MTTGIICVLSIKYYLTKNEVNTFLMYFDVFCRVLVSVRVIQSSGALLLRSAHTWGSAALLSCCHAPLTQACCSAQKQAWTLFQQII